MRRLAALAALLVAFSASPALAQFAVAGGGGFNGGTVTAPVIIKGHPLPLLWLEPDALATSGSVELIQWSAATTLVGNTTGINIDLSSNLAAATTVQIIGINNNLVAQQGTNASGSYMTTRSGALNASSNWAGSMIQVNNTPAMAASSVENGILLNLSHGPSGNNGTDTTTGILLSVSPSKASSLAVGETIQMGANSIGYGLAIQHSGNTAGSALANDIALTISNGNNNVQGVEMADGRNVGTSATNTGRLRFNSSTQVFEVSQNTAAWTTLTTGGTLTLQNAYNGGAAIVATSANPVSISNASGVASGLLSLTDATTATNGNQGIIYSRAPVSAAASTWTGIGFGISNTPTGTNSFTESGTLLKILHAPISGAGTITDTTVGASIQMTPVASSAVTGLLLTLGSNAAGTSAAIKITNNGSVPSILLPNSTTPDTLSSSTQGAFWSDKTQQGLCYYGGKTSGTGLAGVLVGVPSTGIASAGPSNTGSETSLIGTLAGVQATKTLPANFFVAGKTVRIEIYGLYSTKAAAPGTLTFKVKLGSTAVAASTSQSLTTIAGSSSQLLKVEAVMTCRTTGGSGTVMCVGFGLLDAGIAPSIIAIPDAGATFDTTASQVLDVTATFGTADVANIATGQTFTVETLN